VNTIGEGEQMTCFNQHFEDLFFFLLGIVKLNVMTMPPFLVVFADLTPPVFLEACTL
jgi:hypothetical protein